MKEISAREEGALVEDWAAIRAYLPAGWQERAVEMGAMRRARGFRSAEALLRTLLIHLAEGCSLRETAVRARAGRLAEVSDVAIWKRLQTSEDWLRWMALELTSGYGTRGVPDGRGRLRLRVVDATTVSEPGSTGSDWRLHYALELKTLRCDFFELTDVHGGESYTRVPVRAGDLMLGDRGYESLEGVSHVVRHQGEVLVRMKAIGLPLKGPGGGRFDLLERWQGLGVGEVGEWKVRMASADHGDIAGRVCAVRRSQTAAALAEKRLRARCSRSGCAPQAAALQATQYVSVFTTVSPAMLRALEVLELYRGRWQIETCFKRLKSVIGLGHLPKYDDRSCRAWLYGKLLVALLAEHLVHEARHFSPWGYPLRFAEGISAGLC